MNHKRVARLMREDNLLAVQPRAFVTTTNAQHELEVYLNLASRLTLTGLNQLWVADKTLEADFFAGALREVQARRQRSGDAGGMASTPTSEA